MRRWLDDIARITTVPALWPGSEPPHIVSTFLDALIGMPPLAFALVKVNDPEGGPSVEMVRVVDALRGTSHGREIVDTLRAALGDAPFGWPPSARVSLLDAEFSVTCRALGVDGEFGFLVAASHELDFPDQTDEVLLNVAATQLTVGLRQTRMLSDQKRVLDEIDKRVTERTLELATANEALKESERQARLIFDGIPGLVAVLTATGEVEAVNRQVFDYFGQTLQELRQWVTRDTVHPEDLPVVIDVFTRSIQSGSPYNIVQRFRRFDGVYRWFQNLGFPLRDRDGDIVRWCVLLTDIDDQRRAQDALRGSERNLKLTIDTIPALAWSTHPDGSADFFNQHYVEFVGLSAEQMRGWGWTAALHPDDLDYLAATWQRILASEKPGEAEARLRRHDGEYRWFLFRASPLCDEKGKIIKWYGINTDIEDRKRAEAELRRAYESFAGAQRLSRTGNFIADIVADDHTWSAELYRIFEIDPATKITLRIVHDMIHPEDVPAFDVRFERSLGGADFDQLFRIVTPGGKVKHLHAVGHLIEWVAGRPLFVGAIQDVTERKLAEEALDTARSELANMTRVATLSALTASIAHELNQPLAGIITNASTCLRMLERDPPKVEGARETARRTIRDGNRASDVITRLRALFSNKDGVVEPLDLNEATREVIAMSLSDLQRNHVILRLELDEDLPAVTGDRVQLQQVILNLLRNASDAMIGVDDRPRHLLVQTKRDEGDCVRVTVQDAGSGINSQSIDRLFDPFYTTKNGGMGIGLSLSRSIIERHHGRLWATPNEGPGATFTFLIPRSLPPGAAPATFNTCV
ncbi:MAG TPA: PAS domain-containing protein [Bryobacteraceae bacterium]|nr:PAS domain-containing protein [Bryobacteraceae bacterium]